MFRYLCRFVLSLACLLATTGAAQAPAKGEAKPDYSKEAFVVEEDSSKVVFENDGTSTRETSTRVRVQAEAGVQHFGVLTFAYQGATDTIEIDYVKAIEDPVFPSAPIRAIVSTFLLEATHGDAGPTERQRRQSTQLWPEY